MKSEYPIILWCTHSSTIAKSSALRAKSVSFGNSTNLSLRMFSVVSSTNFSNYL